MVRPGHTGNPMNRYVASPRQGAIENPMLAEPEPEPLQKHTLSDIISDDEDVETPSNDESKQLKKSKKKNGAFESRQGKRVMRVTQTQAEQCQGFIENPMLGQTPAASRSPEHRPQTRPHPPPPTGPPPTASRSPPPPTPPVALEPATGENATVQKTWSKPREL